MRPLRTNGWNVNQGTIEVVLHNKEMAEAVEAMLREHYGIAVLNAVKAYYACGWVLHVWMPAELCVEAVGRIYLMLSVNGAIKAFEADPAVLAA